MGHTTERALPGAVAVDRRGETRELAGGGFGAASRGVAVVVSGPGGAVEACEPADLFAMVYGGGGGRRVLLGLYGSERAAEGASEVEADAYVDPREPVGLLVDGGLRPSRRREEELMGMYVPALAVRAGAVWLTPTLGAALEVMWSCGRR